MGRGSPPSQPARSVLDALGSMDVFCFPLRSAGRVRGAVLLYLPPESRALGEKDEAALEAVGELLATLQDLHAAQDPSLAPMVAGRSIS